MENNMYRNMQRAIKDLPILDAQKIKHIVDFYKGQRDIAVKLAVTKGKLTNEEVAQAIGTTRQNVNLIVNK